MDPQRAGAFHVSHRVEGRPQAGTRFTVRVEKAVGVSFAVRRLVLELSSALFTAPRFVVPLLDKTLKMSLRVKPLSGVVRGVSTTPFELGNRGPHLGRIAVEVPC